MLRLSFSVLDFVIINWMIINNFLPCSLTYDFSTHSMLIHCLFSHDVAKAFSPVNSHNLFLDHFWFSINQEQRNINCKKFIALNYQAHGFLTCTSPSRGLIFTILFSKNVENAYSRIDDLPDYSKHSRGKYGRRKNEIQSIKKSNTSTITSVLDILATLKPQNEAVFSKNWRIWELISSSTFWISHWITITL